MQTGMIHVFEEKFKKLLKKIEKEYEKPKAERDKDFLKRMSKEAKSLRKLLKQYTDEHATKCPHCGEKL